MKLYIMRHGEAAELQEDPARGLTTEGKEKIEKLAQHLFDKGMSFAQAYHSTKKRAQQTAEIIINKISPETKEKIHQNIKPNDDPEPFSSEINSWLDHEPCNDTLVVSHLPFMPNLISLLTKEDVYSTSISFEPGTVVCLENNGNSNWKILWSTSPSEI